MNKRYLITTLVLMIILFFGIGCRTVPGGLDVIDDFEKDRYLGKWYEIARLDHSFERNLNNVTAEYSIREDGKIKVVNRGYNSVTGKWSKATGKAKFAKSENIASLKVSFFGPFYAPYNVVALDDDYKYALVLSTGTKYMWILSRETSIPDDVKQNYLKIAKEAGINTSDLIWVEHKND